MNGYLKAGETLIVEGAEDNACYWIQKGRLQVTTKDSSGKVKVVNTLKAGDIVGEMAFFDNKPRSCTVHAITNCEYMTLHREEFEELIANQPKWVGKIISSLIDKVRKQVQN